MTCGPIRRLVLGLLLGLFAAEAPAAEDPSLLIVAIHLNDQYRGGTWVLRDDRGNFYLPQALLAGWEIAEPYPDGVSYRGTNYHPVAGFDGASAEFDALTMTLRVSMPATLMPVRRVRFGEGRYTEPSTALGFYLDYDLNYQHASEPGQSNFSTLLQPRVFGPAGSVNANLVFREFTSGVAGSRDERLEGARVLDLAYVKDDPANLRSLRVGDTITNPGTLGRSLRFGGIQFATNFGTQPALITYPLPDFYGQTAVPSAIDVYVNGQLRNREQVAPGPYVLEDVPVINGAGQLQVITQDALGRQQLFVQDFYVSTSLLKEGLSDYSFSIGWLREDYGLENFSYGDMIASANWRYGYTDQLTLEGHSDVGAGVASLGGTGLYAIPAGGVVSAGVGLSSGRDGGGAQWLVGFEQSLELFRYNLRLTGASRDFTMVDTTYPTPKLQAFASGGFNLPFRGSIGLALSRETFYEREDRMVASLNFSTTYRNGFTLSAFLSYVDAEDDDLSAGIRFAVPIGDRHSLAGSASRSDHGKRAGLAMRSSLPAGPGYSYYGGIDVAEGYVLDGGIYAQSEFGSYSLDVRAREGNGSIWQLGSAGSVAHLDGLTRFTRRIGDAFAVVNVGDVEGVRVYFENQEVGRTDENGQVFVPGLRPYLRNQLRIEPTDLPLNVTFERLHQDATPYFRSGVVADFGISRSQDVLMRIVLPDGSPLTEGAVARLIGRKGYNAVGRDGRLYLEGIDRPSQVTIRWDGLVCDIIVPMPEANSTIPNVGDIVCEPRPFQ